MTCVNLLMSKPLFKSSLISVFPRALGKKEDIRAGNKPAGFDFTGRRTLQPEDNAINTEAAELYLNIRHMSNADAKTIPIIAMTTNALMEAVIRICKKHSLSLV